MNDLLITIAIPAYNNEKTIKKTIDSCLNQKTDIKYEIMIADDASQDSTPEILAQYSDQKIRVVTLDERVPLIDNHNVCLGNARGRYVVFCHADDTLEEHAIEMLADKLKQRKYPKKYIVWGHSMFRDFSLHIQRAGFSTNEIIVGEYSPLIFMFGGLTPSGTCYSRDSILELGGFLAANHRLAPFDMTSMLHYALKGFRFEMIDDMILMRTYASTATVQTKIEDVLESLDDAFKIFIQVNDKDNIDNLLNISTSVKDRPFRFYYALAQDPRFEKRIKKILLQTLIRHPLQMKNKVVRKLMQRVIF